MTEVNQKTGLENFQNSKPLSNLIEIVRVRTTDLKQDVITEWVHKRRPANQLGKHPRKPIARQEIIRSKNSNHELKLIFEAKTQHLHQTP